MKISYFFEKLKYVKVRDIGHIFLFLAALPVALIYKRRRRDLWLICDNGNEGSDNGFHFFEYVCKEHPEQDAVFAIHRSSNDFAAVAALGKTVEYGSFRHWILYLTARVNISSQKSGKPNFAVCNLLEVYGILRNNRVFLQHGVILNDIPFLYYENTKMSMFTTSTYREWKSINDNYGYPEGAVKLLGLPRFDKLHDIKINKGQILIMPTWREWIGTEALSKGADSADEFKKTEYFTSWNSVINSPQLKSICERYGCRVMFYLHRDAQRFADCFDSDNPYLTICKYPEYKADALLKSSAFMITDYSSVQVDFAYMKKPLAYYMFDRDKFFSQHYRKGYFDYDTEGFGPVFYSTDKLLEYIDRSAKNSFCNTEPYLSRHKEFFTIYDTDNCKRNFEAIKERWN